MRQAMMASLLLAGLMSMIPGPASAASVKHALWGSHEISCRPLGAAGDRSDVHGFVQVDLVGDVIRVKVMAKHLEPGTRYHVNIVQARADCSITLFNGSFVTNRAGNGHLRVRESLRTGGPGLVVKVDLPEGEAFGTDLLPEPS